MMEWQDIESAPKDGTVFLVYEPEGAPCISVAFFATYEGEAYLRYADDLLSDAAPEGPEATYWMHLPPPPSQIRRTP